MTELISATITVITTCVNTYTEFCAFEEECETFRRTLVNVAEVLGDVQLQLSKTSLTSLGGDGSFGGGTNTKLRRPMELLHTATVEGGEVLRKCSGKRKLLAMVFSRQLMGMLNKAKADIEEALRLLQVSSVKIQVSTRRMMDSVSDRLDELHKQIRSGYSSPSEVADLVRAEMTMHRESHGASVVAALSEALLKMGVVSSPQDCAEQFAELQREADSIRQAKVIYDEEMLEAVKALTAATDGGSVDAPQRQGSETMATAVQACLVCPISGQIMHDPVTVVESGLTYDRESLCGSLLLYPDLEPGTGQRFDQPLHYTPSIVTRNMIMAQYGDAFFQKYNDDDFKAEYAAKWKEKLQPPPSVVDILKDPESGAGRVEGGDRWTDFDAFSAFTDPTSGTSGGSSSGRDASDRPPGGFDASSDDVNAQSVSPDEKSHSSDAALIQTATFSSDADSKDANTTEVPKRGAAAAAFAAAAQLKERFRGSYRNVEGPSTALKDRLRDLWSSRRVRWLVAGAGAVILVVVVAAAAGASKPSPPTTNDKFKASLPPSTIESLQDSQSPQYRAFTWVTQSDQVPLREEPDDEGRRLYRMRQRFALSTLLYSIKGFEESVESTESECLWGNTIVNVTCNTDSQLIALGSNGGGTGGTLPPEIGLLTNLTSLYLSSNELASGIPTEVGQLSALTYLNLYSNDLASSIPTELGLLKKLTYLRLSSNDFNSSIPTELGLLSALTYLSLYSNDLTSSIPTELGQLKYLERLYLGYNDLSGSVPSALCEIGAEDIDVDCSDVDCSCCGCSST